MPLINHSEFQQDDEGRDHIIEVVLAVVEFSKSGSFKERVSTVLLNRTCGVGFKKTNFSFKYFHANHSKYVIDHLWGTAVDL